MFISTLNILLLLFSFPHSNEENSITKYLSEQLNEYNNFEYSIVSPKNLNDSDFMIDDARKFKISGEFAYLPIKHSSQGNQKSSVITLKLKLFKNVFVANREIGKKEYLSSNDFKIVEKEVSGLRFDPINTSLTINSFRSRTRISEKSILQNRMIEKIPEIEIGDRVEAIFSNNTVNVSFLVTARSEGITGKIIKVKRDDKKIFKAKILNNTTVKIIE